MNRFTVLVVTIPVLWGRSLGKLGSLTALSKSIYSTRITVYEFHDEQSLQRPGHVAAA
jgi:hypothetical protein